MSKDFIYTAVGQVDEAALGYISGIGLVRYIYKVAKQEKIKVTLVSFTMLLVYQLHYTLKEFL